VITLGLSDVVSGAEQAGLKKVGLAQMQEKFAAMADLALNDFVVTVSCACYEFLLLLDNWIAISRLISQQQLGCGPT
jgi:uncharacterized Fe-S cluster-containing protein